MIIRKPIGKFIIVKDLKFTDSVKEKSGQIMLFDSYQQAIDFCEKQEFEDVLILKVEGNYVESPGYDNLQFDINYEL